jgi:hypothetical protein
MQTKLKQTFPQNNGAVTMFFQKNTLITTRVYLGVWIIRNIIKNEK